MANIDKNEPKYQQLLKLCNIIMKHAGKEPIDDLLEFKNIDRSMIVNKEVNDNFRLISDEFYSHFDKSKTAYYRKECSTWSFVVLKNGLKQLGLKIKSNPISNKEVYKGKAITLVIYQYSIVE